jgi:hypothetical protein
MSLEYSMFRFSDDYPTAEGLSEMIMQVCVPRGDRPSNDDQHTALIRSLVNAAYQMRCIEQADEVDDSEVCVRTVDDPAAQFMDRYAKACKKIGERCDEGDAWWEDWWPTDCPWHPDDIGHLARLKAGETRSVRRQLRQMFTEKEECDAN